MKKFVELNTEELVKISGGKLSWKHAIEVGITGYWQDSKGHLHKA